MFSNLKTKKRITQLLIAVIAVAVTVTGSAFLLNDFIQEAKADVVDYNVNNVESWNTAINSSDSNIKITLQGDLDVKSKLTPIPKGKTVELYMNGKTIQWYNASSGNTGIMSDSYKLPTTYWGLIENNGTLNITGSSGTVSMYQVGWNTKNGSGHDNYGMRAAAIVNTGSLTIGSGIKVKAYSGQANTAGDSYQDMFIYAIGVYNEGTVTSSGTIQAGSISQAVSAGSSGSNSYSYALSYGIFGGKVFVNGGNIYSEAKSGLHENVPIPKQGNVVGNFAVGVYSNEAVIRGNTSITTKATSWRDNGSNYNTWKSGDNMSWGVGVMYSKTNYPVIGADVDISASYELITDGTFSFPELNGETALCSYSRTSSNGPGTYGRKAYAVAGVSVDMNASMYGGQSGEVAMHGGDTFGVGTSGSPQSATYRSELAYQNGYSDTVAFTDTKSATGSNDGGVYTSYLTMGASGNKVGGQYSVYYRYRDSSASAKLVSASAVPNTSVNTAMTFSPANGVFTADKTYLTQTSGTGAVKNDRYYKLLGTYYAQKGAGEFGTGPNVSNVNDSAVKNQGTNFSGSFAMSANKSYYVWVDYQEIAPTNVYVVAANKSTGISADTKTKAATVTYTGNMIVPGVDFNLGVIDIDYDSEIEVASKKTDATGYYAIKNAAEDGKVKLEYSYAPEGSTNYTKDLPKDVGVYTVKVVVPPDKNIARAGSGNRNGDTFDITLTINPATPTMTSTNDVWSKSGTYGQTISEIVPITDYKVNVDGKDITSYGKFSYVGYGEGDYPTTATTSVKIKWEPEGAYKNNYTEVTKTITLSVAKKAVTVTPANSQVTYGASTPTYTLNDYSVAGCDTDKKASWLAASTFEISTDNGQTWAPYSSTIVPGNYMLRIASFGGDTANYTFSTSGTATFKVDKAPLYYAATVQNKVYDGNADVNVTLEFRTGNVNKDAVSQTLSTTGTLESADAGVNKAFKEIKTDIPYENSDKYRIVVEGNPVATIYQATPEVTPETYDRVYNAEINLGKITLDGESSVPGTWTWMDDSIVPSVSRTEYYAKFTPASANYETLENIPVTINVAKKEVVVSVDNQTVTYGSSASYIELKYDGFTGEDNQNNIGITGSINPDTAYVVGASAGTYPITISMTDYVAENYYFTAVQDRKITVVKKNITITAPSSSVTYGDTIPNFLVSQLILEEDALYNKDTLASVNNQAKFKIETDYTKGADVKNYTVTVKAEGTAENYDFTFVNGTLTVNKAVLTITADNKTIPYGDPAPVFEYTASGWVTDDRTPLEGKAYCETAYKSGDNAGEYAISITAGNLYHPNYTFNFVGGILTVEKLTINTAGKTVYATITHSRPYSEAVFTDTSSIDVSGTFMLKNQNAVADYTTAEDIDIYTGLPFTTVKGIFTPTDSENYNAVEVDVELSISRFAVTGKPVITGTAMDGKEITASVAGMNPSNAADYDFTWYVAGAKVDTGTTYSVKASDVGKSIYVEAKAKEANGFTGTQTSVAVVAVEAFDNIVDKAQLDITGTGKYTYDGATHGVTVAVKSAYSGFVSDDIKVYYNGQTALPYNAGTYVVTVDVGTPDVPANANNRAEYYGPVSGLEIGTITIEQATYIATFEVADKVYDGTKKVLYYNVVPSGTIENDDVNLDASLASVIFSKASAGTHPIDISGLRLIGEDAGNYKLYVEPTSATISKKVLKAAAEGVERQYNGSAEVNVNVTIDTTYLAAIDSTSTVYITSATAKSYNVNVGEWKIYDIQPFLGGTSADNYTLEITNADDATVVITKADIVVAPPVVSGDHLVYNADFKLENIDLEEYYTKDGTGYWVFDNPSTVPTVRKTQYAATFVVPEDSNYKSYKTNITVNILPKEVVLKAKDVSVAYGKAATYAVEVSGFTGSDSLSTMAGTQPSFTCTYVVGSNVGDYIIKVNHNLDSNGNYEFTVQNGTLKVVPAELYVTATAVDKPYDGSKKVAVNFNVSSGRYVNDSETDVYLSMNATDGTAKSENAGTRVVDYVAPTLEGPKAKNYKLIVAPSSGVLTVNITKLNPEGYVFPANATLEFGYSLAWAEFSDCYGDGTFAFTKGNEVPSELGSNYSYEVTFTPTDSVNYNTVTKFVPLTVTECEVNYVAGIAGKTQVGERLTVVITGLPSKAYEHIKYQWYRQTDNGAVAITGANTSTYSPVENDVGCEIFCLTYFEIGSPFVYSEGTTEFIGDVEGVRGTTIGAIAEENLTFWQRLVRWFENIIQALQGIIWGLGM